LLRFVVCNEVRHRRTTTSQSSHYLSQSKKKFT
jgi:hypothetical protein